MNDAQTWTAIGGILTTLLVAFGLVFRSLETTMKAGFDATKVGFDMMNARFDRLETRFDRLEVRVDGLDRDVTTLTRRFLDGA